jgi:hypothetical protein
MRQIVTRAGWKKMLTHRALVRGIKSKLIWLLFGDAELTFNIANSG